MSLSPKSHYLCNCSVKNAEFLVLSILGSYFTLTFVLPQGQWKNKFDKDNVYASNFRVSSSRTCSVNMMYQETKFRYSHLPEEHVQLLEMPYRGDDITMVIVLPARDVALSQVGHHLLPVLHDGLTRWWCSSILRVERMLKRGEEQNETCVRVCRLRRIWTSRS